MSYSPPEPPSSEQKSPDFDEFIAVIVAFISIGLILLWSLTRKETQLGPAAGRLLGEPPEVGTAARGNLNGGQSSEIFSLEAAQPSSPLEIFQSQPNTPDKFAQLGRSTSLGVRPSNQSPSLNQRDSFPLVSEQGGLPGETASDIAIQPDEDEVAPLFSVPEAASDSGDNLPALPSSPLDSNPLTANEPLTASLDFSDVADDYWAMAFIDALSARGLLSGFPDGTFQPENPLTRAELATLIAKVFTLEVRQNALDFRDIPETYWAASDIKETVIAGFMSGYPEAVFKPDQAVSRVQVLVAVVSGLALTRDTESPSAPASALERYQDRNEIPSWAIAKVAAATEMELVVNYPNLERLQPNKPATRAEVAAILNRALVRLGKLDDSPSSFIVRP